MSGIGLRGPITIGTLFILLPLIVAAKVAEKGSKLISRAAHSIHIAAQHLVPEPTFEHKLDLTDKDNFKLDMLMQELLDNLFSAHSNESLTNLSAKLLFNS